MIPETDKLVIEISLKEKASEIWQHGNINELMALVEYSMERTETIAYHAGVDACIEVVKQRMVSKDISHYNVDKTASGIAKWEHEYFLAMFEQLKKP